MKRLMTVVAAAAVGVAFSAASHAQTVSVDYSDYMAKHISQVDQIEQTQEERFRKYRVDERHPRQTIFRNARWRFKDSRFAGETLIPELENYTVSNLLGELIKANLGRIPASERDDIRVTIESIKLSNHAIAAINGVSNYVRGTMARLNADGGVKESTEFTANLVTDVTVNEDYDGDKFLFAEIHRNSRVGPTLSHFVKLGLERLYPDHADAFTGPILLTYRDPQTQLIQ